ncbi:MAG TPA: ABC transporter substrate-binding protein [Stellaceae bacterium]|nr:ABC transporter substrate-binding protein [Stellaceae bacterium]
MFVRFGARTLGRLAAGAFLLSAVAPAFAAEPDAAPIEVVKHLDGTLLDVMQNAKQLGYKGRYAKIEPLVRRDFNVRMMTQIAVGSGWSGLTPAQQDALTEAFGRFIAATYAERFDGYSGERFVETGARPFGSGQLVETKLVKSDGSPVDLSYVTRQSDGNWQVVDIFMTGTISELATRRSEFSAVFRRAGYDGLLQSLNDKVAQIERQSTMS